MASHDWGPSNRNYDLERKKSACAQEEVQSHPLHTIVTTIELPSTKPIDKKSKKDNEAKSQSVAEEDPLSAGGDPLSGSLASDPLTAALIDPLASGPNTTSGGIFETSKGGGSSQPSDNDLDSSFEPWSIKRTMILSNYTTSEKLSITTSFLSDEDKVKLETKAQAAVTDTVKHRLEQLDDFEEGSVKEMLNLSQQEYVKKIDDMNRALCQAWDRDQKVKALKIAIQAGKLLVDISVIQFYPSKFVLITDILDNFGNLVFDRIRRKSTMMDPVTNKPVMLQENFSPDQVPDIAKETCRNWFFKIASIRELIPRFYVEAAILKCYSFLTTGEYSQALIRLTKTCRGIGDPLVAAYARAYMCRVGMTVSPTTRIHLLPTFTDFLATIKQFNSDAVQNTLVVQKLELPKYLHLFLPSLDWVLQCIAHKASEKLLEDILNTVKQSADANTRPMLLHTIMEVFEPNFVALRAIQFSEMIKECDDIVFPKYKLYVSLGVGVVLAEVSSEHRLPLLNDVWKSVMKLKLVQEYISCAEIWVEFVAKHFGKREMNTILADIIKHMTPDRAFEAHYSQLNSIIGKILANQHNFAVLFSMDKFLPFVDMFQRESVKVEVCKTILSSFINFQTEETNDPIIINAMMYVCKILHDSFNSLSLEDERRQISSSIIGFLNKINFGRDFEQQLSFYVEVRATFSNLDAILVYLIQNVNLLAMNTSAIVGGNHTRKTAAFVRACAAYCFITIPSLSNILERLNLYLLSGRVAVANGALTQGDAFFKAAISSIKDVPEIVEVDRSRQSTEPFMSTFISNFLSALLVVPDNPDQGVLYLLRGLLKAILDYPWQRSTSAKDRVYLNALSLLSAYGQEKYLYGIANVDSNDSLYGSDKKFIAEISKIADTIINLLLEHLKQLSTTEEDLKNQSKIAFGMFSRLISHADITEGNTLSLAMNLWTLSNKHGHVSSKLKANTLRYIQARPGGQYQKLLDAI
ncbi:VPS35 endosomal protein-sorting factor-like [Dysidea avara]|uniref:VPS35 endosomal protein-sorting factor-like n=1 Tax=Dysidea avara TaxID=196820 RepID=UPI003317D1CA